MCSEQFLCTELLQVAQERAIDSTYLSYSARDSGPLPLHNTGFDKKFTNLNQKQIQCIESKVL